MCLCHSEFRSFFQFSATINLISENLLPCLYISNRTHVYFHHSSLSNDLFETNYIPLIRKI